MQRLDGLATKIRINAIFCWHCLACRKDCPLQIANRLAISDEERKAIYLIRVTFSHVRIGQNAQRCAFWRCL